MPHFHYAAIRTEIEMMIENDGQPAIKAMWVLDNQYHKSFNLRYKYLCSCSNAEIQPLAVVF